MWSQTLDEHSEMDITANYSREHLLLARTRMAEALQVLDEHSISAAAASLDMALHQLDRELSHR